MKCAPSASLVPFVEHYWVSRWDRRGLPARDAAMLSDPCVHLLVQGGHADVMGVVRGTYRQRIEDIGCVVGVKFRPGGFYPFVQRTVSEWTDRVVPAEDVFDGRQTSWAADLSTAAMECSGGADEHAAIATAHLDAYLGARLPARDATAERVADLVSLIEGSADLRRVPDLVRVSGRSERTLHRLFARYVGVTPAWVIRRYRLQAAAARLTAQPPEDVKTLSWELGYADQAHFIRDFHATIGVTPGAYVQSRQLHT
ncbi:MAG: helix-turn-helix domain-containing protein [Ilumatobacteraceae bacterium]